MGLASFALVTGVLMATGVDAMLYVPPLMIVTALATAVAGPVAGVVAASAGIAANVGLRGGALTSAYLLAVLIVAVILTDRVATDIRRSGERADRSLGLLRVLISALRRVAEAPAAREAEDTLPGLLGDGGAGGLLVWRTVAGEPEAVVGGLAQGQAPVVAEAVRDVARERIELERRLRSRGRVRYLTAVPVLERGDVVAVFTAFREEPMASGERAVVREFTAALGHVLTRIHAERSGELVLELAKRRGPGIDGLPLTQAVLDLVLPELHLWGGALLRYRAGRFMAEAVAGPLPVGLRDRLEAGLPYGEGVVWEAYREGRPVFIDDYASHGAASSELAAFGVGAVAIVPAARGRPSHGMLALFHHRARPWLASEKALVADMAAMLSAFHAQLESETRLEEMAQLQRELLGAPVSEMYQRLVEAAVRLVHGSEAASLLVRGEDGLYRYAAVVGFDAAGLSGVRFTIDAMEGWYGAGAPGWSRGQPRVLVSREGRTVGDVSELTSPSQALRTAGRVDEIVADLCLPVLYRGQVLAILNLDAMHDPDAFGADAVDAAASLAPFVGFVLHESEVRDRLAAAARTDELTGLWNRRAFNEHAADEVARAVRYGEPLALLIMDLWRFKRVNDGFGHAAGDLALRAVADALRGGARVGDRLYRWGGDEFAALLPHADAAAAQAAADRIAREVAGVSTPAGAMGVNIGVACVPSDGEDLDTLVRVADDRMFRAKASGRATVDSGDPR